jgi:hypothetical protein
MLTVRSFTAMSDGTPTPFMKLDEAARALRGTIQGPLKSMC